MNGESLLKRNCLPTFLQGKEKKKAPEIEPYKPPVISLENEDSVFFSEPFAIRGEFQNR